MNSSWIGMALCGLFLAGCSSGNKSNIVPVKILMEKQVKAWNQGDIRGFMEPYWHSDSLVFIGKRGLTYGWEATLANYRKSYPDRASMGMLEFDVLRQDSLSPFYESTVGKWTLYRTQDTLSGHFSLLWQKIDGAWKIISDHSS